MLGFERGDLFRAFANLGRKPYYRNPLNGRLEFVKISSSPYRLLVAEIVQECVQVPANRGEINACDYNRPVCPVFLDGIS